MAQPAFPEGIDFTEADCGDACVSPIQSFSAPTELPDRAAKRRSPSDCAVSELISDALT